MLVDGTRPMDNVLLGFCLTLAFAVARTHAPNVRFYAWFKDCGLEISKHRGFGQTACKAFGAAAAVLQKPWISGLGPCTVCYRSLGWLSCSQVSSPLRHCRCLP